MRALKMKKVEDEHAVSTAIVSRHLQSSGKLKKTINGSFMIIVNNLVNGLIKMSYPKVFQNQSYPLQTNQSIIAKIYYNELADMHASVEKKEACLGKLTWSNFAQR